MRKTAVLLLLALFSSFASAQTYAWDTLRPVTDFAQSIEVPVKIIVFLAALFVFLISAFAYQKSKSKRIMLVSFAFFFLSLKWLVKIVDLFYSPGYFISEAVDAIFELATISCLLVALFYRKNWGKFFEKEN